MENDLVMNYGDLLRSVPDEAMACRASRVLYLFHGMIPSFVESIVVKNIVLEPNVSTCPENILMNLFQTIKMFIECIFGEISKTHDLERAKGASRRQRIRKSDTIDAREEILAVKLKAIHQYWAGKKAFTRIARKSAVGTHRRALSRYIHKTFYRESNAYNERNQIPF